MKFNIGVIGETGCSLSSFQKEQAVSALDAILKSYSDVVVHHCNTVDNTSFFIEEAKKIGCLIKSHPRLLAERSYDVYESDESEKPKTLVERDAFLIKESEFVILFTEIHPENCPRTSTINFSYNLAKELAKPIVVVLPTQILRYM